ncbi:MAG: hypothetical protein ACO3Z6_06450 [Pseudomonadales bacterium]
MHQGLLNWHGYRYLRWTIVLLVATVSLYVSQYGESHPPQGSTWQGYVLGIAGAIGIIWLALLGIRKRSYRSRLGTLGGWASAHVYLGALVLVLSTLHSAFELTTFNVHTLTYWLMLLVVLSGFFGLYVYVHLPARRSANLEGHQPDHWIETLREIDRRIADQASRLRLDVAVEIMSALRGTTLGGTGADQLLGRDRSQMWSHSQNSQVANTDQRAIIERLSEVLPIAPTDADQTTLLSELFTLFGERQLLLRRLRHDIRHAAWLRVWLHLHIPCTFALLIALSVHVFSILFYW